MQQIKMTAPKLNTLIDTKKISRDLGYQILGLILGKKIKRTSICFYSNSSSSYGDNSTGLLFQIIF